MLGKLGWSMIERTTLTYAVKKYNSCCNGMCLDLGCGNKEYKEFLKVNDYIGVDVSKDSKADILCDAHFLPFKNACFDSVLCTQMLEHVQNPNKVCSEIVRILKAQGTILLSVPMIWELHEEPNDYYRYTKYGINFLLKKNGFKILHIESRGGGGKVIGQMISLFIKGVTDKTLFKYLIFPLVFLCQMLFVLLDKLDKRQKLTLGYVIVAKKDYGD